MRSPFCRRCPLNLSLRNGHIRYLSNRAFHYCLDGYRMQGPAIRNCLRTSKWSLPVPYCRSKKIYSFYWICEPFCVKNIINWMKLLSKITGIHCGHLPNLPNGQFFMEKTNAGEIVKYVCNDNYYLAGSKTRYCLSNGTWSDSQPECISMFLFFTIT